MIKVIKTEGDYEAALASVQELVGQDPSPGSREFEQLELLIVLVQDYENRHFDLASPSPLDAIRFRMEQQGLTHKDLVPYLGSRSKVSEVLSGKRPLTLAMIRALHTGLAIPAHVLVRNELDADEDMEWDKFPLAEMLRRGWIHASGSGSGLAKNAETVLKEFFQPIGTADGAAVLFRRSTHVRGGKHMDRYALAAWTARIARLAAGSHGLAPYRQDAITMELLTQVARLSAFEDGPRRAREFLADHGIALVLEPQLPRTQLDGAAIRLESGRPIIGMTVRYDRIDNFWFTLLHELAHIALHFQDTDKSVESFFDDLEVGPGTDSRELEADEMAGETLIPQAEWEASPASKLRAIPAALHLAERLHLHPAIVAGRMRHEHKDYRVLASLIGQGEVRRLFPEVSWP